MLGALGMGALKERRKRKGSQGKRKRREGGRKISQRNVRPTVTLAIKPLSPTPGKGSIGEQTCREEALFSLHLSAPTQPFLVTSGPRTHTGGCRVGLASLWVPGPPEDLVLQTDDGDHQGQHSWPRTGRPPRCFNTTTGHFGGDYA